MNQPEDHTMHPLSPHFSQLRRELPVLNFASLPVETPSMEVYRQYYQLNFPDAEHRWGTFTSGDYRLAAHISRCTW